MTERIFVDTNVLIYAYDLDERVKHPVALSLLEQLWLSGEGCLSTQVLQEFYVNITRNIPRKLRPPAARAIIRDFAEWVRSSPTKDTVIRASEIEEDSRISFWDALIIAAAEEAGAAEVLTEDLNHGQIIAGIRITNPFR